MKCIPKLRFEIRGWERLVIRILLPQRTQRSQREAKARRHGERRQGAFMHRFSLSPGLPYSLSFLRDLCVLCGEYLSAAMRERGARRAAWAHPRNRGSQTEGRSRLEMRLWKTISCGGESWLACGAFCAPAFADPYLIFSCPRQSPIGRWFTQRNVRSRAGAAARTSDCTDT
jgi:hypothetical protein